MRSRISRVSIILIIFATLTVFSGKTVFAQQGTPEVGVCTWAGCKTAAASFSYDDSVNTCRAEMEAEGFRGTYYHIGSDSPSWLTTYSAAGHEIGLHTTSHNLYVPACFPNCTQQSLLEIPYTEEELNVYRTYELEQNIQAVETATGLPVLSMAWPYGATDAKRMTAATFYLLGVRGFYDPVDSNFPWVQGLTPVTPPDFFNFNSITLFNYEYVEQAIFQKNWVNIVSHGSCDGISYVGGHSDKLWIAPVGDVLKYIKVRDAAQFTNYLNNGSSISFDVVHNLPTFHRYKVDGTEFLPVVYDNAVTLKVRLLDTENPTGVTIDGQSAAFNIVKIDGVRYLTLDAALLNPRHVVVTLGAPLPQPATEYSLWDDNTIPATISHWDTSPLELGVKFRATENGYIRAIKFFKGTGNTGDHHVHLWTAGGTLLAEALATNESSIGWQTVSLPNPVAVTAGTTYIASYHTNTGRYSVNENYFQSAHSSPPLYAFSTSENGGNGVYREGPSGGFPNASYAAANYWVDVVFTTDATVDPTPTFTPTGTVPTPTATNTRTPTPTATPLPVGEYSLWNTSNVPAIVDSGGAGAMELGLRFRANQNGLVSGLRFYKAAANTGTHLGHLWGPDGTLLGEVTFANETASGWQTAYFSTPIAITANTMYTVSYHTTTGHFSINLNYFAAGRTQGPLYAYGSGEVSGNGVYGLGATTYPSTGYNASNFWVDVIFTLPSSGSPTPTNTPVPPTVTNTPVTPTITNTPVTPTITNTPVTPTVTNTPVTPTVTNTPVTPTITNTPVTPTATNTPVTPTATNTPVSGGTYTFWDTSATPTTINVGEAGELELGMRFRANQNGLVSGLRFYKSSQNTGTHLGHLWGPDGAMLGEVTFTNETASGWQTAYFSTPIAITANTMYTISYHTTTGYFSVDRSYFNTGLTQGPLYAYGTSEVSGNGVYRGGAVSYPTISYSASNYWVDVIFTSQGGVVPTPQFTATNTPIPSPTPTATSTPSSDLIFADGFESGNLSAWSSSSTNNGALLASSASALNGTGYGLEARITSNTEMYVSDTTPNTENQYRARFYFDPNSITMSNGNAHYILLGYYGSSTQAIRLELRYYALNYQIRASVRTDSGTYRTTSWFTISDAPHYIEINWVASTAAGANNGSLSLWIDGVSRASLNLVDNDTQRIDMIRLGPVSGLDTGTRGTYYFDQFQSNRQLYIGP